MCPDISKMMAWPGQPSSGGAAVMACQTPFSTMMDGVAEVDSTVQVAWPCSVKVKKARAPFRTTKAYYEQCLQLLIKSSAIEKNETESYEPRKSLDAYAQANSYRLSKHSSRTA